MYKNTEKNHIKFIRDDENKISKITVNDNYSIEYNSSNEKEILLIMEYEDIIYEKEIKRVNPFYTRSYGGKPEPYKCFLAIVHKVISLGLQGKKEIVEETESILRIAFDAARIEFGNGTVNWLKNNDFLIDEILIKGNSVLIFFTKNLLDGEDDFKISYIEFYLNKGIMELKNIEESKSVSYQESINQLFKNVPHTKKLFLDFL